MTEQELTARLKARCQDESRRRTAGDGGVHSMDEILRELMAEYQPLTPSASSASVPQLVAC